MARQGSTAAPCGWDGEHAAVASAAAAAQLLSCMQTPPRRPLVCRAACPAALTCGEQDLAVRQSRVGLGWGWLLLLLALHRRRRRRCLVRGHAGHPALGGVCERRLDVSTAGRSTAEQWQGREQAVQSASSRSGHRPGVYM